VSIYSYYSEVQGTPIKKENKERERETCIERERERKEGGREGEKKTVVCKKEAKVSLFVDSINVSIDNARLPKVNN
jgi:hypothetical protein